MSVRLSIAILAWPIVATLSSYAGDTESGAPKPVVEGYRNGSVSIEIGMKKADVKNVIANGKQVFHHKDYVFRPLKDEAMKTDVWELWYGPEVPGIGHVDQVIVTFAQGKVSVVRQKSYMCP